ncbi:hypothetical protein C8J57DRAFT_1566397 [Mycena rebaudengoi]|nr:hypothetical protein C8J57DRAFT_1566397 [Mycena rebaudengoi]
MSLCCQPLESGVAPKPGVGIRTVSLRLCSMAGLCLAIRCPAFYRRTMTATAIVEGRKNDSEARSWVILSLPSPSGEAPVAHTFTARLFWTLCAQTTAYPSIFASEAAKVLLHVGVGKQGSRPERRKNDSKGRFDDTRTMHRLCAFFWNFSTFIVTTAAAGSPSLPSGLELACPQQGSSVLHEKSSVFGRQAFGERMRD